MNLMLLNMVNYMNKIGQSSISQSSTVQWKFQFPKYYVLFAKSNGPSEPRTPDMYVHNVLGRSSPQESFRRRIQ